MKFAMRYKGGNVPPGKYQELQKAWGDWYTKLRLKEEDILYRTKGGKVVSSEGVSDYDEDLKGAVVIIETESFNDAIEKAKACPSIPYGMKVEVLEEYI